MAKMASRTMTVLLRKALRECGNLTEVQRATGVLRQSMMILLAGRTIRLDSADLLARHFGIQVRAPKPMGRKVRR